MQTSSDNHAILLEDVWKAYQLGFGQGGLRTAISGIVSSLIRGKKHESPPQFFALKEINLRIKAGEAVGLIGRNGAGKTTVLKLISGITQPSRGRLAVQGRVSALIELGAGFHPELTGRENIYLNGTILGLKRREITARFDNIVAFAELERFIDTPVKRYSSGMYARLGFSVAAHTDPDILLVDEVLAVGDRSFQQKCFDFIHHFVRSGRTTLFVSHNLYIAEQLCDRLIWLDEGRIRGSGAPGSIVNTYLEFLEKHNVEEGENTSATRGVFQIEGVWTSDSSGVHKQSYENGETVVVNIHYNCERVEKPNFCVWVSATLAPEPIFGANMLIDGNAPQHLEGEGIIQCWFNGLNLMPRNYHVWLEVYGQDGAQILFRWQRLAAFQVEDRKMIASGLDNIGAMRFVKDHAPVRVNYEWHVNEFLPKR